MEQPDTAKADEQALLVFASELVLPDAEDAPADAAEGAGDEAVAGLILGNLSLPEFRVLLGLRGVEWAAVPETAVDEDGEFAGGEYEIGFTEDPGFTPPAGYTV
jgi:hypothetical protein